MLTLLCTVDSADQAPESIGEVLFLYDHNFALNNILCAPKVPMNSLYVSKFTRDNSCFIEFHPTHFHCEEDTSSLGAALSTT